MTTRGAAWIPALLVAAASLWVSAPAAGQEEDPRFRVYVHEVGFFPDPERLVDGRPTSFSTEIYTDAADAYFKGDMERFRWVDREARWRAQERLVQRGGDGPTAIETYYKVDLADQEYRNGVEAFSFGDVEEAERRLKEAEATYRKFLVRQFHPERVARVYQHMGLIYSTIPGRRDDAIEAFERMLLLNPRQVLVRPEKVARMNREARASLLESRGRGPSRGDRSWLNELGELVQADMIVWGYVVQKGDAFELTMQMYRVDKQVTLPPERVTLTGDPGRDAELANRLVSRFAACVEPLPEPPPPPPDREEDRIYLDAAFAYATYLSGPTDQGFDNYGVSIAASYMMTDRFAWVARATFLTSGSDFENDLLTEFSQVRLFAGGGFGLRFSWVRPFLSFAVEASRLGPFSSTDEFFCKVSPASPGCAPSEISDGGDRWQLGVNVQAGLSVRFYEDFSVFAAPSLSFYVLPLTDKDLDLPIGADFGIQYRF